MDTVTACWHRSFANLRNVVSLQHEPRCILDNFLDCNLIMQLEWLMLGLQLSGMSTEAVMQNYQAFTIIGL